MEVIKPTGFMIREFMTKMNPDILEGFPDEKYGLAYFAYCGLQPGMPLYYNLHHYVISYIADAMILHYGLFNNGSPIIIPQYDSNVYGTLLFMKKEGIAAINIHAGMVGDLVKVPVLADGGIVYDGMTIIGNTEEIVEKYSKFPSIFIEEGDWLEAIKKEYVL